MQTIHIVTFCSNQYHCQSHQQRCHAVCRCRSTTLHARPRPAVAAQSCRANKRMTETCNSYSLCQKISRTWSKAATLHVTTIGTTFFSGACDSFPPLENVIAFHPCKLVIEIVIAFVIQALDQIKFTIASTSESDLLSLCMYLHRYHASTYILFYF